LVEIPKYRRKGDGTMKTTKNPTPKKKAGEQSTKASRLFQGLSIRIRFAKVTVRIDLLPNKQ
jgi:hypothetical protein